jgi:hypothetical protein
VPPDQELVLIFGALHLMALVFGGLLLLMFFRSETRPGWRPPEDEDDGGGGGGPENPPAKPSRPSPGGLPLESAEPSRVRLREPGRLADQHPFPVRRPQHAPDREKTPVQGAAAPLPPPRR